MLSSGFGDVRGTIGNALLKKSIQNASLCGCRTSYDLRIAKKYGSNSMPMPDFCFLLPEKISNENKTHFAWVISNKMNISIYDIKMISARRSLIPIAILLFPIEDGILCDMLMKNNIKFYSPENFEEFAQILRKCAFTLSERLHGAIFSILAYTPSYITTDNSKKRAIVDEIYKKTNKVPSKVLQSYNKHKVIEKKEIGVQDSDFKYVINLMRCELTQKLDELF